MKTYRVWISIRARAQTPFDDRELRSEDFDSYEEYAEAVGQFVLDNIYDDLESDEDEEEQDETNINSGV